MEICCMALGKTDEKAVEELIAKYLQRLKHYTSFQWLELPDPKRTPKIGSAEVKRMELDLFRKHLQAGDMVILLDEHGKTYRSLQFAEQMQKWMNASPKRLVFLIGGPFGFADELHQESKGKLSLSSMTFSHQIIRPLFLEQIYRAFTILRNEPYHHE